MKSAFDWKDLGAAFSLAVLWFINVWQAFIYSESHKFYYDLEPLLEYSAMIINVAVATFILLVLIKLSKRVSSIRFKRILQIVFLALALSAFSGLGSEIMKMISPKTTVFVNPLLPTIVLCICAAFSFKQKFRLDAILSKLKIIALFLLPFALLTCFQLFWFWLNIVSEHLSSAEANAEKVVSKNQTLPSSKKIVWIIFDGADYAAITNAGKNNFDLPDIERLMSESFVAGNAFPPNVWTQASIPALLTGKTLKWAIPTAVNDITLYPEDGSPAVSLRKSDNLIAQLNDAGVKTGIAGWYHPYSRIFNDKISCGYWFPIKEPCYSLPECSGYMYRMSLQTVPFMTRIFPSLWFNINTDQIERHKFLNDKADELIARPELNFLFFHFSVPHKPFIDRRNLAVDKGYFYSLEVVNDTIKRLRDTLEKTGQSDNTVLIISSDHFLREKTEEDFQFLPAERRAASVGDTRIPFIVKFPGQKHRLDYEPPFNTVITKELILSIFKEEVGNAEELASRLDNLAVTKPELINFRPDITVLPDFKPYIKGN